MPNKRETTEAFDRFVKANLEREAARRARQIAQANFEEVDRAYQEADRAARAAGIKLASVGLRIGVAPIGGPPAA